MSVSITAWRLPKDKQGKDISDNLISSETQAAERGRIEIDRQSTNRTIISGTCTMHSHMVPGKMVQVTDLEKGNYMAMLRSFSLTINRSGDDKFSATTNVVLERNEETDT